MNKQEGESKRHVECQGVSALVQARLATLAPGPATLHGVTLCPQPWLPFPPCSLYPKCLPCIILTVPTICQSHCSHHARRTLHGFHAHPSQRTHNHQTPHEHHSCCTQCTHTCCIHRTCHVYSTRHTHQYTQHTYCVKPNLPCSLYQSCCAHRAHHTYCACSVVHLHRKHPRWLCRQRACVCQAIEQERLEGLLLREGAEIQRGGGGHRERE